ncbi:MAG: PKD domain-containing protein [Patescibacteria group bacterium]
MYHRPGRTFKIIGSLTLSSLYFVFAIGLWNANQQLYETAADTPSVIATQSATTCPPASQFTETFDSYATAVDDSNIWNPTVGTPVSNMPGWTGEVLNSSSYGNTSEWKNIPPRVIKDVRPTYLAGGYVVPLPNPDFNSSYIIMGPSQSRAALAVRPSKEGTISFLLTHGSNTANGGENNPLYDVTLSGLNGTLIQLQYRMGSNGTPLGFGFIDPTTGSFRNLTPLRLIDPGNILSGYTSDYVAGPGNIFYYNIKVIWTQQGFDVYVADKKLTSAPVALRGASGPINKISFDGTILNVPTRPDAVWAQNPVIAEITYPTGSALPCLTTINPATGLVGTSVTLTGERFEPTGNKVTLTDSNRVKTIVNNLSSANGKTIVFAVPDTLVPGAYGVTVTTDYGTTPQELQFVVIPPPTPGQLTLSVAPSQGQAPLEVTAVAQVPSTLNQSVAWNFGDGSVTTETALTLNHTYAQAGTYTVMARAGTLSATATVTVTMAPVIQTTQTPTATTTPSPTVQSTPTPTPTATATPSVVAKPPTLQLIATGGSLTFNLIIAALLSALTAYIFFRRSIHETE